MVKKKSEKSEKPDKPVSAKTKPARAASKKAARQNLEDRGTEAPSASRFDPKAALFDNPFANTVKDSAQQIWQAGLAAFSKAQAEGGKVFDTLVKEGAKLQRQQAAPGKDKRGSAGDAPPRGAAPWDRLESIFEGRTAQALGKLGIPTAHDLEALSRRIDALSAEVARLSKAVGREATQDAASVPRKRPAVARKGAPAKKRVRPAGESPGN